MLHAHADGHVNHVELEAHDEDAAKHERHRGDGQPHGSLADAGDRFESQRQRSGSQQAEHGDGGTEEGCQFCGGGKRVVQVGEEQPPANVGSQRSGDGDGRRTHQRASEAVAFGVEAREAHAAHGKKRSSRKGVEPGGERRVGGVPGDDGAGVVGERDDANEDEAPAIELVALRRPSKAESFDAGAPKDASLGGALETLAGEAVDRIAVQASRIRDHFRLSAREAEVMELLARGNSVARIAEMLVVSENTVRTHSKRIYVKLDIHKRQELVDLIESF